MQGSPSTSAPLGNARSTARDIAIIFLAQILFFPALFLTLATWPTSYPQSDMLPLSQPIYTYSAVSILQGEFPFWNPYWFAGYPHFALPSSACLYPFTLLFGIFSFPMALKIDTAIHLFLLGTFSYFLGRDVFKERIPAIALALLATSGRLTVHQILAGHIWTMNTLAYVPLVLLCLRRVLQGHRGAWTLGLAVAVALQVFGGDAQMFLYEGVMLAAFAAFELARRIATHDADLKSASRDGLRASLALAGGLGLAAAQILPSSELLAESVRSEEPSLAFLSSFAVSPTFYWNQLILNDSRLGPMVVPGALSLMLCFFALVTMRSRQWGIAVVAATGLFCAVYSTMPNVLLEGAIQHIPFLNRGRVPLRMAFFAFMMFYIAIGYGLQSVSERLSDRRTIPVLAILLAAFTLIPFRYEGDLRLMLALVFIAVAAVLALAWRRKTKPEVVMAIFLIALTCECAFFSHKNVRFGSPDEYGPPKEYAAYSESRDQLDRVAVFAGGNALTQGTGLLTHDRVLGGYHALYLKSYATFLDSLTDLNLVARDKDGAFEGIRLGAFDTPWLDAEAKTALDLLNVRYLVTYGSHLDNVQGLGFHSLNTPAAGELAIYENGHALPVAYVVHDVISSESDSEILQGLASSSEDYHEMAYISADETLPVEPRDGDETVEVTAYAANEVELRAKLTGAGLVILTDVYYPGWQVSVDGKPAHLYRVNTLLRGVFVEHGDHQIRFSFHPRTFYLGLSVSLLSACALIVWAMASLRSARRRTTDPPKA